MPSKTSCHGASGKRQPQTRRASARRLRTIEGITTSIEVIELRKVGTGTLTLTGANTYTGGTTIASGTLQIGNGGSTGSLFTDGAIVDNGALVINRSGTLKLTDVISGSGSLTQNGTGTLILGEILPSGIVSTNPNAHTPDTYSGATSVNHGTLELDKQIASSITVANGASLRGGGSVADGYGTLGSVTVSSGGTVAPGTDGSVGILNTGSLILGTGSFFSEKLNGNSQGGNDQIRVTGMVNLDGSSLILSTSNGNTPTVGDSYTIINNDGADAIVGKFANADANNVVTWASGQQLRSYSVNYAGGDGNDVVITYIGSTVGAITPTVSIGPATLSAAEGNSGAAAVSLTITLSAASAATTSVSYATHDGSAAAGSDYTAVSDTLYFAPNETSKTITIPILGDTVVEGNETFSVSLSNPSGLTLGNSMSVITIVDDDVAPNGPGGGSTGSGGGSGGTNVPAQLTDEDVGMAFQILTGGSLPSADIAKAVAAIKAGATTFDAYIDTLINQTKISTLPGVVMWEFFGATPTKQHLAELTQFSAQQFAAYANAGVLDPAIGPYEAIGLSFSDTATFKARYGQSSDDDFLPMAYQDIFGRAPTTDQTKHFNDQITFFEKIYTGAGQSAAQADLHAKGAILGQMMGFAVIYEAHQHNFDDNAISFLHNAAKGQAQFGEGLLL